MYIIMYLMYRSGGDTHVWTAAVSFPSPVFSFAVSAVSSSVAPVLIVCLKCITSSLHSSPPPQEWFNVQLKLSKAIDARCVMIPADLQMELLIPPPPPSSSSFLFLRHNISGLFFLDPSPRAPFVVRVLWVPCCSSNKNRDEKKKKKKTIKR